jgi:ATP-binding cassette subfamily B protein RaxB
MLMAFMSYRGQFDSRVTSLIDQFIELRMLRLYGERLADVVLTPGEEEIHRSLIERPIEGAPDIQITDLKFRYAAEDPWVLDGITVNIKAGEAVAITGPSGCGKNHIGQSVAGGPEAGRRKHSGRIRSPRKDGQRCLEAHGRYRHAG